MEAAGERIQLAIALAEIFGGQVDFENDLQPGDLLEVLVEKSTTYEGQFAGYGADPRARDLGERGRSTQAFRWIESRRRARPAYYDEQGRSLKRFFLKSPLKFEPRVTSGFSMQPLPSRPPALPRASRRRLRRADRRAGRRRRATASSCRRDGPAAAATQVRLRHAGGLESYYLHLSAFGAGIRAGARVDAGTADRPRRHRPAPPPARISITGCARTASSSNPRREHAKQPPGEPIPASSSRASGDLRDDVAASSSRQARRLARFPAGTRCRRNTRQLQRPARGSRLACSSALQATWKPDRLRIDRMASIHPFRALRPARDTAAASPPFPTTSSAPKRRGSSRPAIRSVSSTSRARRSICRPAPIRTRPSVYAKARENLDALRAAAPLVLEDAPSLYFYRLRMGGHEQTGIAGCFSVDEYEQDVIKKHERTRRDKEDDRTRHIVELRAQTGVVFLTYRASAAVDAARRARSRPMRRSTISRADDGVQHTIWRVRRARMPRAGGRLRADPGAVHRRRASPRRERGARARGAADAGRGDASDADTFIAVAFPRRPDADPARTTAR